MIADIFTVIDLGSASGAFVAQATRFAETRRAFLRIAVAAPVHALESSLALAGGYALPIDLEHCAKDKEAEIVAAVAGDQAVVTTSTWEGEMTDLIKALVTQARVLDLTLVGPPEAYADKSFRRQLLERLALCSGRPVLMVPKMGLPDRFTTITMAWNGSGEAARALADALALVEPASQFDIVEVCRTAGRDDLAAVCHHLRHHGHHATAHRLAGKDEVADQLLAFSHARDPDLLVLGAYGHSRVNEMLLGGVTRDLVDGASVPILFSH